MNLVSKVVVITGASAGLGHGMGEWFASRGAGVGMCARRVPDAPPTGHVLTASADVTDISGLGEFATGVTAVLGQIDLWINNAGAIGPIVPQRDLTYEELESHLAVNVGGVLNGTRVFLRQLADSGHRGALVNISSGLAQQGRAGVSAYAAGKAAVDRLTEVAAVEEPDLLTMALAVSPGVIETSMQMALRQQDPSVLHDREMFVGFHEDDVMNTPAWVAAAIADWVFGDVEPDGVVVRVPNQKPR